jgi:hypothetical protein
MNWMEPVGRGKFTPIGMTATCERVLCPRVKLVEVISIVMVGVAAETFTTSRVVMVDG